MSSNLLHIRRAIVDDLPALKAVWISMRLPADHLESRLTEFQVVERAGEVVGAVGFQIVRTAALLHSEGFSDFSVADAARELFWERLQILAANHGVFRLWTQENSPFWLHWGFQSATAESLERLPDEWKNSEGQWFTLELKNEDAVNAALKNQFSNFLESEKKSTGKVVAKAKTLTTLIIVVCFLSFFICLAAAAWLFMHRR
ncbi:MAG TPA: hypothetical protein VIK53_13850 [Verrucomicrobiae bacterium]